MQYYLGVDYGKRKIGLAIAYSSIAEPLQVLRYESVEKVVSEIEKVIKKEGIEKIIMGLSEGESAEDAKVFGKILQEKVGTEVIFQDETLSTKEAQALAIEAGINRAKRKDMEDAYAATIILQNYLDNHSTQQV
jgi:putative holliday junction resolvase